MTPTELEQLAERIRDEVKAQSAGDEGANAKLLDSIERLRKAVEPPAQQMSRLRFQVLQNVALVMAEEMGILDRIVERKGNTIKLAELSHTTGYEEDLIARIMRVLTAVGVCDEVVETTYRSNEMAETQTQPYDKGETVLTTELTLSVCAKIRSYVTALKQSQLSQTPVEKDPYKYALGISVYDDFKQNPRLKKAFDDYLVGRGQRRSVRWHHKYPAAAELGRKPIGGADEVLVVDIGGAQGFDLISFREETPNLSGRLVLQDLPETFARMDLPLEGIDTMAHNFFSPQPIRGARLYYIHSVCHNWADDKCRKILSRTAEAMDSNSRLLIDDRVLKDVGESAENSNLDLLMLLLLNGVERSLYQWRNLLSSTSPKLRIVKIWDAPGAEESIIEAALET